MLSSELGTQLQIENDINLATSAESIRGRVRRHESFTYPHIRTDAGLTTIFNGELHRSFHGATGELAYLFTATGIGGRVCVLKNIVSAHALTVSAQKLGLTNPTLKAALQLTVAGDPAARQVMDRFVENISAVVTAINVVLGPECVVLSNGIGVRLQDYVIKISGAVARCSPSHVDLGVATLHTDTMLRGAIGMGLKTARNAILQLGVPDDLGWRTPSIN